MSFDRAGQTAAMLSDPWRPVSIASAARVSERKTKAGAFELREEQAGTAGRGLGGYDGLDVVDAAKRVRHVHDRDQLRLVREFRPEILHVQRLVLVQLPHTTRVQSLFARSQSLACRGRSSV
eukprot:3768808-Rhodomonas_salina.4